MTLRNHLPLLRQLGPLFRACLPVLVTIAISSGAGALPGSSFVGSIDNAHFPQAFTNGQKTWSVRSSARLGFSERRLARATIAPSDHLRPPAQITSQSYQEAFPPADSPPNTWYVSRRGNNGDGQSWETAWNELDQIDWSVVPPGSTVLIDGGSVACDSPVTVTGQSASPGNCGMVYESTLTPKSDVTVQLGTEGTVVIFGGRSTPLPYCGQSGYGAGNGRSKGIVFGSVSNAVVDGTKWGGIMVYGHGGSSVDFSRNSQDILVRNIEVFDNGTYGGSSTTPNRPGVDFSGTRVTFERALVHDNGQDAFQSGGGVQDFTIRESWLYNLRPHPSRPHDVFNHCSHTDGIQIWGGGEQNGFLIEDSIFGPGFTQGIILGNPGPADTQKATINEVTIRNSLFFKSTNNNMATFSAHQPPTNWLIENVTSFRGEGEEWWNIRIEGSGHTVRDSVFYGGRAIGISANDSGNCSFKLQQGLGANEDPQFADMDEADWFSLDDFTVQNPACEGSRITSVEMLIGELPTAPLPGDLNQDGHIDVLDVQLGVNVYLGTETQTQVVSQADVNRDGDVNVLDIQIVVNAVLSG